MENLLCELTTVETARKKSSKRLLQGLEAARARHFLWRRIRGPFVLPGPLRGHNCSARWERYDGDQAGCRMCGTPHWCGIRMCNEVISDDSHVCSVTGLCLRSRMHCEFGIDGADDFYELVAELGENPDKNLTRGSKLAELLFSSNRAVLDNFSREIVERKLARQSQSAAEKQQKECFLSNNKWKRQTTDKGAKTHSKGRKRISTEKDDVDDDTGNESKREKKAANTSRQSLRGVQQLTPTAVYEAVNTHVKNFFTNTMISQAISHDHLKLTQQLRAAFTAEVRACMRNKESVNWVCIEGCLHTTLQSHRIPVRAPQTPSAPVMQRIVEAIWSLIFFMSRHCKHLSINLRQPDFVVGILYLLRSGINVFHVVVLPQITELSYMLPSEQHLQPALGVRAKAVSEAENCIKHQLRKLPSSLVARFAQEQFTHEP